MEIVCSFPLFTILLCLLSGVLCTLMKVRQAYLWTTGIEAALLGLSAAVLVYTLRTGASFTYVLGEFPAPWGNELRAGALEALMAVAFNVILLCAVTGGRKYLLIDVDPSKQNLYYALVNLTTAALMALVWTNDLFTGYVFVEILTLSSCGLIAAREIGRTTLAAVRYMIMNLMGSGLFLLGVVLLYALTGHLLMVPARGMIEETMLSGGKVPLVFALTVLTLGLGIKSGLAPSYFWMPDTYGSATPTSAAILSALVSKGYLFLLLKIYCRTVGTALWQQLPLRWMLAALGLFGMAAGSLSAMRSNNLNRMTAYSSAAQIGYIFLGFGLAGTAGFTAAVFQMLAHAVTKSLLFITTPRLASVSEDSLLFSRLRGSGRRDRTAGFFFTAAALSMVGVPFLAGFSVKLFIAGAAAGHSGPLVLFSVMAFLGISSVLNAMYYLRTVMTIYAERREETDGKPAVNPPAVRCPYVGDPLYLCAALTLTAGNLFLGLCAPAVVSVIQRGLSMFS